MATKVEDRSEAQTSLPMQSRMGEEALVVRVRVLTGQS